MTELTTATREAVVRSLALLLRDNYAYPETAEKMAALLEDELGRGAYECTGAPGRFAAALTETLRSVAADPHLLVFHDPEQAVRLEGAAGQDAPDQHRQDQLCAQLAAGNYGFKRVEHLAGNVGYVDIRQFAPVEHTGEKASAVMAFLADSDALIFDLRSCGGGDPFTVQLIESYLFPGEPRHLLTLVNRPQDRQQQLWTLPHVPGKRLPDVPVYVLTSGRTFSGGEDFAYTLQHLGRATVVGEVTGGGAHTVEFMALPGGFVVALPTGYPRHPITGGNWEGTGVIPDVQVPREQALPTAHRLALECLVAASSDTLAIRRLRWELARLDAVYKPLPISRDRLATYAGRYREWVVTLRDDALYMTEAGRRDDWRLLPLSATLFAVDEEYNARFDPSDAGMTLVFLRRDDDREIAIPRDDG